MRITYRQLKSYLDYCSQSQLDCDVSIEIDDEVYYADFRITGDNSTTGLETNHPVIVAQFGDETSASEDDFMNHINHIYKYDGFGQVGDSIEDEDEILRRDHKNGLYGDE
jgi:hypothetical protein